MKRLADIIWPRKDDGRRLIGPFDALTATRIAMNARANGMTAPEYVTFLVNNDEEI